MDGKRAWRRERQHKEVKLVYEMKQEVSSKGEPRNIEITSCHVYFDLTNLSGRKFSHT